VKCSECGVVLDEKNFIDYVIEVVFCDKCYYKMKGGDDEN